MINPPIVNAGKYTDAELVARSVGGDREAFSQIVTRYQILICSLAYCRIGHLGQSEDVAQETFITAWKRLRLLREPAKLRAWLCGIVNYRIHKALRREGRDPARLAEPLEVAHETPAVEALPSEQTISREEAAILWRSLERIPALYRDPLVLFYREHESVAAVAAELEISEDAVKQRLARGRKLLQEEVQAFVESTLRRTAPGRAFSGAVLAALPVAPAAGIGAGMAGKGAAAAKAGLLGAWLAALAPFAAILLGALSQGFIVRATTPPGRERRAVTTQLIAVWSCVIAAAWGGQAGVKALGHYFDWDLPTVFVVTAGFWWLFVAGIFTWFHAIVRRNFAARAHGQAPDLGVRLDARQRLCLATGMHLAMFTGLITLAWNSHDGIAVSVLAGLMVAMVVWHLAQQRSQTGLAAAYASGRHYVLCCLVLLAALNLRLDVWLAARYEVRVAEIHQMFPMWLVPLLTLALIAWGGLLAGGFRVAAGLGARLARIPPSVW
jgi:RNA polymerase sigma factor (sigma-70 family)